ncbi:DUF4230 domain-containing protein [Lachnospiraceae bacterium 47-T17]
MGRGEEKKGKQEKAIIQKKVVIRPGKFVFLAVVLAAAGLFIRCSFFGGNEAQTTVLSTSQLEKVLKISELSVYKVTFNGVAAVNDEDGKLLYNVAYNAKVRIGFDMEALQVSVDETDAADKKIVVTLPKVGVIDADVDPGSLDYIFAKKRANTDDVSATAYPACVADAKEECGANEMISKQATENAVNTIKALSQPLLAQYPEYSLEIVDEGGVSHE